MQRPKLYIDITGPDGNIYCILGKVSNILKEQRRINDFNELRDTVYKGSYCQALYNINKIIELIDTSQEQILESYIMRGKKECMEAEHD